MARQRDKYQTVDLYAGITHSLFDGFPLRRAPLLIGADTATT